MKNKRDLIQYISKETLTNKWVNNKVGFFHDFDNDCRYRFIEDTDGWMGRDYTEGDRSLPVIATGYVGFLIKHWGNDIQKINEAYYDMRLKQYRNLNKNEPDSDSRNIDNEFCLNYKTWENEWIEQSVAIFEFLTYDEKELIKAYIKRYFRYVDSIAEGNNQKQLQIIIPQNVLDWLEIETCSSREINRNGKPFIESAKVKPLKWLQNKQLLRELLTHLIIRGKLTDTEIEKQSPFLFIDIHNKPLALARNKPNPNDPNSNKLATFLNSL